MTKVQRISADLYSFIDEDTNVACSCKGDLALKQIEKLNESATDTHRQDQKSHDYTINLFWTLIQNNIFDDREFIEFIKSAGSRELKIATGRTLFNDKKYKAAVKAHNNQMQKLIDQYNMVITNNDFDLATKERSALEIMRGFNELKKVVINKSQKEFLEPEFETVEISAEEALEIVKQIKSKYDLKCENDVTNKRTIAIEQDKDRLKDISEDDFAFIKKLQRLIDSSAFFNMFEFNPAYKYGVLSYDSIEDFINRDREFEPDVKLELSNNEMSAVRFVSELHKIYCDRSRNNTLKENMLKMVESLKEK